jgi:hypothetical protein
MHLQSARYFRARKKRANGCLMAQCARQAGKRWRQPGLQNALPYSVAGGGGAGNSTVTVVPSPSSLLRPTDAP